MDSKKEIQHVYLVGAKSLGAYGGYETFVYKLTEYHQNKENIKYHVACKANGDGCMDESKFEGVTKINDHEFEFHNAHCFKIDVPQIGSAQAIYIDLDDGVSFEVKDVSNIMDEMEYPGIRVTMNANVGRLITPLKIDISTGDVITPRAIEFNYDLLLEDRSISLWSYNLETILAEKLQTVLARGILNTRMRDFYDIRMLLDTYEDKVNKAVLKDAFAATCNKRGTDHLQEQAEEIIKIIEADEQLRVLWRAYQKKYSYAAEIDYASVISGVRKLMDWIR